MNSADTIGPDLTLGVPASDLPEGGMLAGHVGEENVLLVRRDGEVLAVSNTCTHYSAPLNEGLVVGDTIRCPWHHACFSLRTGEPLRGPALNPIACWDVRDEGGRIFVEQKKDVAPPARHATGPESVVIIGGGAAGQAAAETLRAEGYAGRILMLTSDPSGPYDRPNLSKDYLAGNAPEEWLPLRDDDWFRANAIELRTSARVVRIDAAARKVMLADGKMESYGALLLATGAEPIRLGIPGGDSPSLFYLRSLADSRAIIERAKTARRAVVLGSSFIGLEVAAALRSRGIHVTVVSPEQVPFHKTLGPQVGSFLRRLHEEHGIAFRLGTSASRIEPDGVVLASGERLSAEFIVAGIGVRPSVILAQTCGARIGDGVVVDEYLQTSVPGIFAAGDLAQWPDPHTGEHIRVEHWVVAQRQGQTAARNILGKRERFEAVPFFWSAHYDLVIAMTGHAATWDDIRIEGDFDARDARVEFVKGGKVIAVATIFRDKENLEFEVAMERSVVIPQPSRDTREAAARERTPTQLRT